MRYWNRYILTLTILLTTWLVVGSASAQVTVKGSVFGGGKSATVGGAVTVNMNGGTVEKDVYGGGALADTNTSSDDYIEEKVVVGETVVTGLFTKSGSDYVPAVSGLAASGTTYYRKVITTVNLLGGLIQGDAYGGGLGQKDGFNGATSDIAAVVHHDIFVTLNGTAFDINYDNTSDELKNDKGETVEDDEGNPLHVQVVKSGRVFGCNNLNGSPEGNVTVTVYQTVEGNTPRTAIVTENGVETDYRKSPTESDHKYELAAVYGGGNLAPYTTDGKKTNVIIYGCDDTSILTVYGGGNAAAVPRTNVEIRSCYEIGSVFGGGNGKDKYTRDGGTTWVINPGANVNGEAYTRIYGGTVHEAYGASNEKGTIYGNVDIDLVYVAENDPAYCPLDVGKLVGAGKNADVEGNLIVIMGCKPESKTPLVYAGADNANVKGNVELTITSGNFGKVFGGNNEGGAILGHIKLNIEETGDCATPITIDELYLGGNQASYSRFGYYVKTSTPNGIGNTGETPVLSDNGKLILLPRESEDDTHLPVDTYSYDETNGWTWTVFPISGTGAFEPYAQPVLNVISCTSIGQVFGGGYGEKASMYADPTVNINMIPGHHATKIKRGGTANSHDLGAIGDVFGGGNAAKIIGNTTVNIGAAPTVTLTSVDDDDETTDVDEKCPYVEGAYITGDVFGGGNLANVTGNTHVNICAYEDDDDETTTVTEYRGITFTGTGYQGVTIKGNVFGGGKGKDDDSFECAKAMVGNDGDGDGVVDPGLTHQGEGTTVIIGNGTVENNVYGGGKVGRVEWNTVVTVGVELGTSAPVIEGNVFGAGRGLNTRGYSALVRGDSKVTVQAGAKVRKSVYGGGEIATVGRYNVNSSTGLPETPKTGGKCTVIIQGDAEIGTDDMVMITTSGTPNDWGHVFGAGKGVLPYEGYGDDEKPQHMDGKKENNKWTDVPTEYPSFNECGGVHEKYFSFIKTLALASYTDVTIQGNAFVKGSVYGGSENGRVQGNTHVTIAGNCQIGNGYVQMNDDGGYLDTKRGVNRRYTDTEWADGKLITTGDTELKNVVGLNYSSSLPECASWQYDADDAKPYDVYDYVDATVENPVPNPAKDGHTFYGNVFGGGSGYYPYHQNTATALAALRAKDSGYADGLWYREAGAVYGNTTVDITGGHILTSVYGGNEQTDVTGTCTINMSGGTVGVPRTVKQMQKHPVTCYVFGAGKGDQRINFNTWTNVASTQVNISGTARIYGSTFGGGEDGHVTGDAETNINAGTTVGTIQYPYIGTTGTSGVDGNIFGGGRGFSETALTAGVVGGDVRLNIYGGKILGSVFGGGRLASVGMYFANAESSDYGKLQDDVEGTASHGHITVNISGGTIGATYIDAQDDNKEKLASSDFSIGDVFAGCKGTASDPRFGMAKSTHLTITGGTINRNIYGGGEMGSVGKITNFDDRDKQESGKYLYKHDFTPKENDGALYSFGLSWPYEFIYDNTTGLANGLAKIEIKSNAIVNGHVFGGSKGKVDVGEIEVEEGDIAISQHRFKEALFANVRETQVIIGESGTPTINGSVYGGGEDGHVYDDASITIHNGTIAHSVFGGGKGEGKFTTKLWNHESKGNVKTYPTGSAGEEVHSWTAGKVYGNTYITMNGGSVGYNIYGGGNLASVGKGNYAGGKDDYSTAGYGELPLDDNANLWTSSSSTDFASRFINSGKTYVYINSGTVGTAASATAAEIYGNVFGSSRGKAAFDVGRISPRYKYVPDFFLGYVNETHIKIGQTAAEDATQSRTAPIINGSVYGGGQDGHVRRSTSVTINKGTIGLSVTDEDGYSDAQKQEIGNVFGAGSGMGQYDTGTTDDDDNPIMAYNNSSGSVTCTTTVTINGSVSGNTPETIIRGNVYGGGAMGSVGPPNTGQGDEIKTPTSSHMSSTYTEVNIAGGSIGGNVYGSSRGNADLEEQYNNTYATNLWSTVNVSDGAITGNVFGGGEAGNVKCSVEVNIEGGTIGGDVYGGGALARTNTSNWAYVVATKQWGNDWATGKTSASYTTKVKLTGGTITGDAYGGGLGDDDTPALVYGDVQVDLNGTTTTSTVDGNTVYGTTPISTNSGSPTGCIVRSVFGCNNINGTPMGDVLVHVHATQNSDTSLKPNIATKFTKDNEDLGQGSLSDAAYVTKLKRILADKIIIADALSITVTDYQAAHDSESATATSLQTALTNISAAIGAKTSDADIQTINQTRYDVQAVYGGGNNAAYEPVKAISGTDAEKALAVPLVIIDGCDLTSIAEVYGGGNAASAPGTHILVNNCYEIGKLFGGGNGAGAGNPGANVGYKAATYTFTEDPAKTDEENEAARIAALNTAFNSQKSTLVYGSGLALAELKGGTFYSVFGGSNTRGNVRVKSTVDLNEPVGSTCPLEIVDEIYGGGNNADQDGTTEIRLGCTSFLKEIYGGSKNANINNDVILNITSGRFHRVFGGNNIGGTISGTITVNIEETGCHPIIIGQLYGGGNQAAYSVENIPESKRVTTTTAENYYKNYPKVNVKSFTSIGEIYGGGYGSLARVTGNPYVTINECVGENAEDDMGTKTENGQTVPTGESLHTGETITINSGKSDEVQVEIPLHKTGKIGAIGIVFGGGNAAPVEGDTNVFIGNKDKINYVSIPDDTTTTNVNESERTVVGADIRGNVYGGGNNANVSGDTNVIIGKEAQ